MWDKGVKVYSGYKEENFNLRTMLFGTINDFPAYDNLSRYNIKGQCACPLYEEKKCLPKTLYILPLSHRYRLLRKAFNRNTKECRAPVPLIESPHGVERYHITDENMGRDAWQGDETRRQLFVSGIQNHNIIATTFNAKTPQKRLEREKDHCRIK
ncbi:hypothetical protein CR513_45907, partial [Mucuna pruriens]